MLFSYAFAKISVPIMPLFLVLTVNTIRSTKIRRMILNVFVQSCISVGSRGAVPFAKVIGGFGALI